MAKRTDDEAEVIMADKDGNPTTDRSKAVRTEYVKRLPDGTMEHSIAFKKGSQGPPPLDPVTGEMRKDLFKD